LANKNVLSCLLKDGKEVNAVRLVGRLFHARATVTRNDRSPMVLSRVRGSSNNKVKKKSKFAQKSRRKITNVIVTMWVDFFRLYPPDVNNNAFYSVIDCSTF